MSEHDPVNNPSHYTSGNIEVIEAIEDWKLGFNLGNAVKYIARAGKKDPAKTVEDLKKSRWYLSREIANLSAEEDDDAKTNLDMIDELRAATGYSVNEVMSTALWLYREAVEAKRQGKRVGVALHSGLLNVEWHGLFEEDEDSDEAETDEPEPFKVGDPVTYAIGEDVPTGGVVKGVKPADGRLIYTVEWEDEDGTKWQDEHWRHELSPEPTTPTVDPSKTVTCYRCAKCGMPIAPGGEKTVTYLTEEIVAYHEACYEGGVPASDEAKPAEPKFAVGDQVVLANIETACVGVVKGVFPSDYAETAYEVAWTAQINDARFESELKPHAPEPAKPKFKFGDKVRHKGGGQSAVVLKVYPFTLDVAWENGNTSPMLIENAVRIED